MRLISVEVKGFKRFADSAKMNVDGKTIAVVGPNEAGKTSFLEALKHLQHDGPIPPEQTTRRMDIPEDQIVVRATYLMENTDVEALGDIYVEAPRHVWVEIDKTRAGERSLKVEPVPTRDLQFRLSVAKLMRKLLKSPSVSAQLDVGNVADSEEEKAHRPLSPETMDPVFEALESQKPSVAKELLDDLDASIDALDAISGKPKYAEGTIQDARALIEKERVPHPYLGLQTLAWKKVPDVIEFDAEARGLQYEYDLAVQASDPPVALANLASVADLSLVTLARAIETGETGTVAQLLEEANQLLRTEYESWSQSGVRPRFDTDGLLLRVHVSNVGRGYMKLHERSEGLRSYVALIASSSARKHDVTPIFVIDEAEMHLHYDAQADLMKVLASQDAVAQVIYTTHSAGCLPEDLGGSIRIVEPIQGSNYSTVRNKFWASDAGLAPLLLGMGASTLAFFPTRDAVICEGPTELILLGSLFRQAIETENIGFQIVPGSSNVRPARIAGFDLQAPRAAWLVDGDQGGRDLTQKIGEQGISLDRIVAVGSDRNSGLVIEDLLLPEVYAEALNEEITRRGAETNIAVDDFGENNRPRDVKSWCDSNQIAVPDKVAVANHLVGLRTEFRLVSPDRVDLVKRLHADLTHAISLSDVQHRS